MLCSRCGNDISEGSRFCPACGLDLAQTAPVPAVADAEMSDDSLVRQALAEEYEIREELGRGGMAMVYRAHERTLDREVAIKVLPFALAFDAEFVERFQREARTSAKLEHPNIIPIYRVGRTGRVIYFSMKFLRGASLSHVLRRRGTIPPAEIRRVLLDCGAALGYASQRGVVHRDIKPDNIMFDEFGQLVLTDFGIAKASSGGRLTGTGMSIGTPHYMSPEQARAQQIDGRSDQYALGIVAWQCLAGHVPFDGEDSFAIGYKHITEPLPAPPLAGPDERRMLEIIRRMTMKDPQDRFDTWDDLASALRGEIVAPVGVLTSPDAPVAKPATPLASAASVASTTPLTVPPALRTPKTPRPQTDSQGSSTGRRGVAERSVARASSGGSAWPWLVLGMVALGGGGWWFWQQSKQKEAERSSAEAPVPANDSAAPSVTDSLAATTPTTRPDSQPQRRPDSVAAATPTLVQTPPPRDSGALKVVGLPIGSSVLIDGEPAIETVTKLPIGRHAVAISAPRFRFYQDTVEISANQQLDLTPVLTPLGAPLPPRTSSRTTAALPPATAAPAATNAARSLQPASGSEWSPGYNANKECFDVRPRPKAAATIKVPPEMDGVPTRSTLVVHVSREGKVLEIKTGMPSSNADFEALAREHAQGMPWAPATIRDPATSKQVPVDAWTQWPFEPIR